MSNISFNILHVKCTIPVIYFVSQKRLKTGLVMVN